MGRVSMNQLSMWHITLEERVDSILENGLIVGAKKVGAEGIKEQPEGIYLTTDWRTLLTIDDVFRSRGRLALLKVDITSFESKIKRDKYYDLSKNDIHRITFVVMEDISPKYVYYVGAISDTYPFYIETSWGVNFKSKFERFIDGENL